MLKPRSHHTTPPPPPSPSCAAAGPHWRPRPRRLWRVRLRQAPNSPPTVHRRSSARQRCTGSSETLLQAAAGVPSPQPSLGHCRQLRPLPLPPGAQHRHRSRKQRQPAATAMTAGTDGQPAAAAVVHAVGTQHLRGHRQRGSDQCRTAGAAGHLTWHTRASLTANAGTDAAAQSEPHAAESQPSHRPQRWL